MSNPVSHFVDDELIQAASLAQKDFGISVPIFLPERRIYLYIEAKLSATADFDFPAFLVPRARGKAVGQPIPARLADFSNNTNSPNRSVASLLNAGGSPVGDSLSLTLAQPLSASSPKSVVLQPIRINAEVDEIIFKLGKITQTTMTGYRVYLACLSTKY